jgi:hypothetical protein
LLGRRAAKLTNNQAVYAWLQLANQLEGLGDKDVPKFHDLVVAIRAGILGARRNA